MSYIKKLDYKIENFSLKTENLTLPESGVTAILGSSGAGKTSFLKILIGYLKPQHLEWVSDSGERLDQLQISERRLGVVFQTDELFPHMTAQENIMIVLESCHTKKDWSQETHKMIELQKKLKLEKCWKTRAEFLSGGEKKRVALLRALVSRPRLLLLDEPFSALDEQMREESRELILNLIHEIKIPVLIITHDVNDVKRLASHQISIENGWIRNIKH